MGDASRSAWARGDATRMPFPDRVFGAAYLRWVLHLIPTWRSALAEMVRVVGPRGVVLVSIGGYGSKPDEIQERFGELARVSTDPFGRGWGDVESLDAAMADLGAAMRTLEPSREGVEETIGQFLDQIEANRYSWTWPMQDEVRISAVIELRVWAAERYGALDVRRRQELTTVWRAYDLS